MKGDRGSVDVVVTDIFGNPIDGVHVTSKPAVNDFSPFYHFSATATDHEGRARLDNIPVGLVYIKADAPGWAEGRSAFLEISLDRLAESALIILTPGGAAEGRLAYINGDAASGVDVFVGPWNQRFVEGPSQGHFRATMETAPDGTFLFQHIPPGKHALLVGEKTGSRGTVAEQVVEFLVVEGQTTRLELGSIAHSVVRLKGSVKVDGEPLSGCGISVSLADTSSEGPHLFRRTDDKGVFEMMLPHGGDYRFFLELTEGVKVSRQAIVPSARRCHLKIAFETGRILGHVYSRSGEPMREMNVSAKGKSRKRAGDVVFAFAVTDMNGAYEFERLPSMIYTISAKNARDGPLPPFEYPYVGRALEEKVELRGGQTKSGVDLVLSRAAAIAGIVLSDKGLPISGAIVRVKRFDASSSPNAVQWETDKSGRFQIGGLQAGRYIVQASYGRRQSPWTAMMTVLDTTQSATLVLSDHAD